MKKGLNELTTRVRPVGDWPKHWVDIAHEADGGSDRFGHRPQDRRDILDEMLAGMNCKNDAEVAWDDVSSVELIVDKVKEARALEMKFFKDMAVYTRVPRAHQRTTGGKVIGTRWIYVNKGDSTKLDYRSRLVGQEFATHRDDALYASTPPLEALRLIISSAASGENRTKKQIMICDVRRAYFYAKATRDLYI